MKKNTPLSVVIPTFSAQHLLEKHLPNVRKVLDAGDQVIIVDDASQDSTVQWVLEQQLRWEKSGIELTLVEHATNQRFAAAVNSGVKAARHGLVLLLNNDVSPHSSGFKGQLVQHFTDPKLFAVGCAEITSLETQTQVSGRGTGNFERGLLQHWYNPDQSDSSTLWTSGGSMIFDRAKFEELGGMDTLFYPAYEEDRDLSYRALKHGWRILFDPQAVVLHQHETTNTSVFGQKNIAINSWKNQYLFVWKNITDPLLLAQHLFWLPYYLTLGAFRSGGASFWGFFRALHQLPAALKTRQRVRSLWSFSDADVLHQVGSRRPMTNT